MLYNYTVKSDAVLPSHEIEFLESLSPRLRSYRLSLLYDAGWSLSILGRSINTPKTTIHFWVRNATVEPSLTLRPVPAPSMSITSLLPVHKAPRVRSISPKVPPDLMPKIRQLSEKSRRFRAKTPPHSATALANRELTELAVNLRSQGVPTAAIAQAAGVSYRAMARRIAHAGGK